MKENRIYVEGGGTTSALKTRCREGFRKLLGNSGFEGKMPRIVPCGSRNEAYDDFKTAHAQGKDGYVALLVDSEDPVKDPEDTWRHLNERDGWARPAEVRDEQALLMTTCMETWIVADRPSLRKHYGAKLQESALPSLTDLEGRNRHDIQDALSRATRNCKNAYAKDKRSFEVLSVVQRRSLETLPSYRRMIRILEGEL